MKNWSRLALFCTMLFSQLQIYAKWHDHEVLSWVYCLLAGVGGGILWQVINNFVPGKQKNKSEPKAPSSKEAGDLCKGFELVVSEEDYFKDSKKYHEMAKSAPVRIMSSDGKSSCTLTNSQTLS